MDNLKIGDVLVNHDYDYNRNVLLITSGYVITVDLDESGDTHALSPEQLIEKGWKLKDTPKVTELTVAEVAKRLGLDEVKIVEG